MPLDSNVPFDTKVTSGLRVAIVGCGPWGLCVFERLHASFARRRERLDLTVHIIDPGPPGVGVYAASLPEYLLLNTPCGQIDLFGSKLLNPGLSFDVPRPSFFEWLRARDYVVREPGTSGEPERVRAVEHSDFLPRRWLGHYLRSVFATLVSTLSPAIKLHVHARRAVRIEGGERSERVLLDDGSRLEVDFAFLTLGHGEDPVAQSQPRMLSPSGDTIALPVSAVDAAATVALGGFGLTAIDTLAHLTLGRGGRFVREATGLRYSPSGREPRVVQFSRSGIPYRTRPHGSGEVERGVGKTLVEAAPLQQLGRRRGSLDFRREILPFVLREMRARHASAAGAAATFDPARELEPESGSFADASAYGTFLTQVVKRDLEASQRGTAHDPEKAGIESIRSLREPIRELTDFQGLTAESFVDFRRRFVPNVYRLIVGPPTQKMEEWLELRRSGLLRVPLGAGPHVEPTSDGWLLASTRIAQRVRLRAPLLLSGFAPPADSLVRGSPLLQGLVEQGRARLLDPSGSLGCGLELDSSFHPVGRAGTSQRLFVLGLLSEGSRTFNLYIPSPGSRFRAYTDTQRCIDQVVEASGIRTLPMAAP